MNVTLQAICMIATIALLLAFIHVPLGTWMYRCFTDERDWAPERLIYRAVGVDPHETVEPIRRLKALARERRYTLVPGHDPDVWPALTQALDDRFGAR